MTLYQYLFGGLVARVRSGLVRAIGRVPPRPVWMRRPYADGGVEGRVLLRRAQVEAQGGPWFPDGGNGV